MTKFMWVSCDNKNPNCIATASYIAESNEFEVIVTLDDKIKTGRLKANFEPRFGIDVSDLEQIFDMAGRLSDSLTQEKKE